MENPEISKGLIEREKRQIGTLCYLVHPLFIPDEGNDIQGGDQYRQARQALFEKALHIFAPQSKGEVLCIMPAIKPTMGGLLTEVRTLQGAKKKNPMGLSWIDLYRALQQMSANPENMLLVENLTHPDSSTVENQLDKIEARGFIISDETKIVVGGEWLNFCVAGVVNQLLRTDRIWQVSVDKRVVTGGRMPIVPWRETLQREVTVFARSFPEGRFWVSQTPDAVIIEKRA